MTREEAFKILDVEEKADVDPNVVMDVRKLLENNEIYRNLKSFLKGIPQRKVDRSTFNQRSISQKNISCKTFHPTLIHQSSTLILMQQLKSHPNNRMRKRSNEYC